MRCDVAARLRPGHRITFATRPERPSGQGLGILQYPDGVLTCENINLNPQTLTFTRNGDFAVINLAGFVAAPVYECRNCGWFLLYWESNVEYQMHLSRMGFECNSHRIDGGAVPFKA